MSSYPQNLCFIEIVIIIIHIANNDGANTSYYDCLIMRWNFDNTADSLRYLRQDTMWRAAILRYAPLVLNQLNMIVLLRLQSRWLDSICVSLFKCFPMVLEMGHTKKTSISAKECHVAWLFPRSLLCFFFCFSFMFLSKSSENLFKKTRENTFPPEKEPVRRFSE